MGKLTQIPIMQKKKIVNFENVHFNWKLKAEITLPNGKHHYIH